MSGKQNDITRNLDKFSKNEDKKKENRSESEEKHLVNHAIITPTQRLESPREYRESRSNYGYRFGRQLSNDILNEKSGTIVNHLFLGGNFKGGHSGNFTDLIGFLSKEQGSIGTTLRKHNEEFLENRLMPEGQEETIHIEDVEESNNNGKHTAKHARDTQPVQSPNEIERLRDEISALREELSNTRNNQESARSEIKITTINEVRNEVRNEIVQIRTVVGDEIRSQLENRNDENNELIHELRKLRQEFAETQRTLLAMREEIRPVISCQATHAERDPSGSCRYKDAPHNQTRNENHGDSTCCCNCQTCTCICHRASQSQGHVSDADRSVRTHNNKNIHQRRPRLSVTGFVKSAIASGNGAPCRSLFSNKTEFGGLKTKSHVSSSNPPGGDPSSSSSSESDLGGRDPLKTKMLKAKRVSSSNPSDGEFSSSESDEEKEYYNDFGKRDLRGTNTPKTNWAPKHGDSSGATAEDISSKTIGPLDKDNICFDSAPKQHPDCGSPKVGPSSSVPDDGASKGVTVDQQVHVEDTHLDSDVNRPAESGTSACELASASDDDNDDLSSIDQPEQEQRDKENAAWHDCLSRGSEDDVEKLLRKKTLPCGGDVNTALNKFGKNSAVFKHICDKVCENILSKSKKIVSVWAGYRLERNDEVIFAVITKHAEKPNINLGDYAVEYRGLDVYSDEGEKITYSESSINKLYTNDESKLIRQCIQDNSEQQLEAHSNIGMISACSVRSKGYGKQSAVIVPETCIVFYVHIKGLIPIGENVFPERLGIKGNSTSASSNNDLPIDVREGGFYPFAKANEYNEKLKMGCAICGDVTDQNGKYFYGTLGPFVDDPMHGLCCITCAHVVLTGNELAYIQTNGWNDVCSNKERKCFQPPQNVGQNDSCFGKIVKAVYKEGSHQSTGVEVALISIENNVRVPVDGSFPDCEQEHAGFSAADPMLYNSGHIYEQSSIPNQDEKRSHLLKFGSETKITRGVFHLDSTVIRKHDLADTHMQFGIKLYNQLEVLNCGGEHFASHGDSGALVFILHDGKKHDLRAVGIVEGGTRCNTYIVTPVWAVLKELGLEQKLKSFTRTPPSMTTMTPLTMTPLTMTTRSRRKDSGVSLPTPVSSPSTPHFSPSHRNEHVDGLSRKVDGLQNELLGLKTDVKQNEEKRAVFEANMTQGMTSLKDQIAQEMEKQRDGMEKHRDEMKNMFLDCFKMMSTQNNTKMDTD